MQITPNCFLTIIVLACGYTLTHYVRYTYAFKIVHNYLDTHTIGRRSHADPQCRGPRISGFKKSLKLHCLFYMNFKNSPLGREGILRVYGVLMTSVPHKYVHQLSESILPLRNTK